MSRKMLLLPFYLCSTVRLFDWLFITSLFSGRWRTAEKRVEKAEKEISDLRAALDSKEKDLQVQREELARLQRDEEELLQVEAVECERLHVLASSLEGE